MFVTFKRSTKVGKMGGFNASIKEIGNKSNNLYIKNFHFFFAFDQQMTVANIG